MGKYATERDAAYWALVELEKMLDGYVSDDGNEWGTIVYRYPDADGMYWYSYLPPTEYIGAEREWRPVLTSPAGAQDVAICHTHPNDTGFSSGDKDVAHGKELFPKSTIYMVTYSGAYSYDGKLDSSIHRNSSKRFGTLWGKQYPWMYEKPLVFKNAAG